MVAPRPGRAEQPRIQAGAAGGREHAAGECAEMPQKEEKTEGSADTPLPVERAETLENADAEAENQPMWPAAAHPSSRCWSVCGRIRS